MGEVIARALPSVVSWVAIGVISWLLGRIKGSKDERNRKRAELVAEREREKREQRSERDMYRSIFRLLLLYRLKDLHEQYVVQGKPCPVEVKRSIQEVYGLYSELGGNGQGTHMYHELMEAHVA